MQCWAIAGSRHGAQAAQACLPNQDEDQKELCSPRGLRDVALILQGLGSLRDSRPDDAVSCRSHWWPGGTLRQQEVTGHSLIPLTLLRNGDRAEGKEQAQLG